LLFDLLRRAAIRILKRFGLATDGRLVQIERHTVIEALTTWPHRDLAYGGELMPAADAQGFALWLLEQFQTEKRAFFTNGNWQSDLGGSWTPCTTSTLDGGVIATSGRLAACIWFEDEDSPTGRLERAACGFRGERKIKQRLGLRTPWCSLRKRLWTRARERDPPICEFFPKRFPKKLQASYGVICRRPACALSRHGRPAVRLFPALVERAP